MHVCVFPPEHMQRRCTSIQKSGMRASRRRHRCTNKRTMKLQLTKVQNHTLSPYPFTCSALCHGGRQDIRWRDPRKHILPKSCKVLMDMLLHVRSKICRCLCQHLSTQCVCGPWLNKYNLCWNGIAFHYEPWQGYWNTRFAWLFATSFQTDKSRSVEPCNCVASTCAGCTETSTTD